MRITMDRLMDYCIRSAVDAKLLQEPSITGYGNRYSVLTNITFSEGNNPSADIVVINNRLQVLKLSWYNSENVSCIRIGSGDKTCVVVSAHFKYADPTSRYVEK